MNNKPESILAYGCVATLPGSPTMRQSIRRNFYSARDRLSFMRGDLSRLDYRNHEDDATYNLGDHAIMQASVAAIRRFLPDAVVTPVNWMEFNDAHSECDAIIICGSGYFFLDPDRRLPARLLTDAIFSEKFNTPIVVYGAGVNLADATMTQKVVGLLPEQQNILRRLLKRCTHISVRDEASRLLLQTYTDLPVEMIGDPALFSAGVRDGGAEAKSKRPQVGLNFPFHGKTLSHRLSRQLPVYVETLKKIQKATGCHFQYMVHYDAEVVIAKMIGDAGVELSIVRGDVDTLLDGYKRLNLHLGGMLHSCILAASVGVPCLGLAYDIKHAGFFETIRLPDHCIPVEPWNEDAILHKVMRSLTNESQLREHISDRRLELQKNAFAFLQSALLSLAHENRLR